MPETRLSLVEGRECHPVLAEEAEAQAHVSGPEGQQLVLGSLAYCCILWY